MELKFGSKEFYEVLEQFERDAKYLFYGRRLDREKDKSWWERGAIYEDGETNQLFKLFIAGYSYGKSVWQ